MQRLNRVLGFAAVALLALPAPWVRALQVPAGAPFDVQRYRFQIEVHDSDDHIDGDARIRVRFLQAGLPALTLDLAGGGGAEGMTVASIDLDGEPTPFEHADDRLTIHLPEPSVTGQERTIDIAYSGVPADGLVIARNKYGERTFFGDNWPNRAHYWLPTVDDVSDKALVEFIVRAPDTYQVVANGEMVEETDLGDGRRLTHWRTHVPIPPKVAVIGVARFAIQYLEPAAGVPIQTWVYPQDRDAGFHDFARARQIVEFFSSHIGEFPYVKLANVQSKTRYGGMENAGAIFYSERAVSGTGSNEGLLAHEIAHQWFGDAVTEAEWHHVWLSEGFATYFTQLYMENTYGSERLREGMSQMRQRVIGYHQAHLGSPVVDESIDDLNQLLNANSYQKGGWVLHMLRDRIGDEAFWAGVRSYYAGFRNGNALTSDFRDVMEDACGCELDAFFQQWIHTPGQPRLQGSWRYDPEAGQVVVELQQIQPGGPFQFPIEVGVVTSAGTEITRAQMRGRTLTLKAAAAEAPANVVLDPRVRLLFQAGEFGPAS